MHSSDLIVGITKVSLTNESKYLHIYTFLIISPYILGRIEIPGYFTFLNF